MFDRLALGAGDVVLGVDFAKWCGVGGCGVGGGVGVRLRVVRKRDPVRRDLVPPPGDTLDAREAVGDELDRVSHDDGAPVPGVGHPAQVAGLGALAFGLEVFEGAATVAVVAQVDGALRLRGRLVD